jgi:hypothetical protein
VSACEATKCSSQMAYSTNALHWGARAGARIGASGCSPTFGIMACGTIQSKPAKAAASCVEKCSLTPLFDRSTEEASEFFEYMAQGLSGDVSWDTLIQWLPIFSPRRPSPPGS